MMGLLKGLAALVVGLVLVAALTFAWARFLDGPLAMIPGGPLVSGELVGEPVRDWSFAAPAEEVELQLADEGTSRTTWILVHDGQAYVPASLSFPPGKRWHKRADEDGRAIVRIAGKRYAVTLTRLQGDALHAVEDALVRQVGEKYGRTPPGDAGAWFFRLDSR